MKIEKEIRYYFPTSELAALSKKLLALYKYQHSYHEVTTMYDNPNPELTFYAKEIEYTTDAQEFEQVTAIFEDVLHCKRVSSYERIRNFLSTDTVQITCDQFPYGLMLELELKSDDAKEQDLFKEVARLGLTPSGASNLSCDDMYFKLCEENDRQPLPDIAFNDASMPQIKNTLCAIPLSHLSGGH